MTHADGRKRSRDCFRHCLKHVSQTVIVVSVVADWPNRLAKLDEYTISVFVPVHHSTGGQGKLNGFVRCSTLPSLSGS